MIAAARFIIRLLQLQRLQPSKRGAPAFTAKLLIKPQFEVGRNLGKAGSLHSGSLSRSAVDKVLGMRAAAVFTVRGYVRR